MAIRAIEIYASGIYAAITALSASAQNTANVNTPHYKRIHPHFTNLPEGGVSTAVHRIDTPGSPVYDFYSDTIIESSNTDLITESVLQITALAALKANAAGIRADDEVSRTIINIRA